MEPVASRTGVMPWFSGAEKGRGETGGFAPGLQVGGREEGAQVPRVEVTGPGPTSHCAGTHGSHSQVEQGTRGLPGLSRRACAKALLRGRRSGRRGVTMRREKPSGLLCPFHRTHKPLCFTA